MLKTFLINEINPYKILIRVKIYNLLLLRHYSFQFYPNPTKTGTLLVHVETKILSM